jgi:hypothetical protein
VPLGLVPADGIGFGGTLLVTLRHGLLGSAERSLAYFRAAEVSLLPSIMDSELVYLWIMPEGVMMLLIRGTAKDAACSLLVLQRSILRVDVLLNYIVPAFGGEGTDELNGLDFDRLLHRQYN